jgi:hypothetical protein
MKEVWLRSNRRILMMAMVPAGALEIVGLLLVALATTALLHSLGGILAALGIVLLIGLSNQFRQSRITFQDGQVLFNLRAGDPVAVPSEIVEAFFLGQGPAHLPPVDGKEPETVNLIARLSQKAPEWAHVEVKPALGKWCESYVTIRGTWCEPLSGDVIRRLNRRLREIRVAGQGEMSAAPASASEPQP